MDRIIRLFAGVMIAALAYGQVLLVPVTITDISGTGAAVVIAASGTARTVTIMALSTNTSTVRVGDASISTTRGFPIAPGNGAYYPESPGTGRYPLNSIYYLVQVGDKISIAYVP